jgi:hypothetical protein
MYFAPIPENDSARLATLYRYSILAGAAWDSGSVQKLCAAIKARSLFVAAKA